LCRDFDSARAKEINVIVSAVTAHPRWRACAGHGCRHHKEFT